MLADSERKMSIKLRPPTVLVSDGMTVLQQSVLLMEGLPGNIPDHGTLSNLMQLKMPPLMAGGLD